MNHYLQSHTILLLVFRFLPESFCRICFLCAVEDVWFWCILTWLPLLRLWRCLFPNKCPRTSQILFFVLGDTCFPLWVPFLRVPSKEKTMKINIYFQFELHFYEFLRRKKKQWKFGNDNELKSSLLCRKMPTTYGRVARLQEYDEFDLKIKYYNFKFNFKTRKNTHQHKQKNIYSRKYHFSLRLTHSFLALMRTLARSKYSFDYQKQ